MGRITKTMQPKHEETISPWLKDFVQSASSTPLPLLPEHLATFPTRWPFPRGDLYHWIPLLNRFDNILESFSLTYKLNEGPQSRDLGCELLLNTGTQVAAYGNDTWDMDRLSQKGYQQDGDRQLIEAILKFTRVLLEHCGNRSIYASSAHLNDLLNTTSLTVIIATLQVGSELAKRYQASVKRIGNHSRHVSTALLANHYNIDLDRVQQLAAPFVKTPLVSLSESAAHNTPGSAKGKEKAPAAASHKNAAAMFANDLTAIANSNESRWNGWADLKISYVSTSESQLRPYAGSIEHRSPASNLPSTPTPLRRSTTMGGVSSQQTPRSGRPTTGDEASPSPSVRRSPGLTTEQPASGQKVFDLPQSIVQPTSIYDLVSRCPPDAPPQTKYELLNRLRIAKALLGDSKSRQQVLAVRLLAITNLAYIHQESTFIEKVMRPDNDETRRFQLVYQLAELIHPSADGTTSAPLWLQAIALSLLEAISTFQARYQDVLSALNANVNHGILLYVIRKAVAGMKEDDRSDQAGQTTEVDDWRKELFSLTQHLAMSTRIGAEMVSAGLMEILVEILKIRSNVAQRIQSTILGFVDGLIWSYQNAFQAFFNGNGLDTISDLLVTCVKEAAHLTASGRGTKSEFHSSIVDYDIPFHQQQTLKWLLKFMHHMMTNSYSIGGNTDRLLRNLVDKSDLLASLREIMQDTARFGSVLWTNSVTVLGDFINNDPTSFAAIAESNMISGFLESVTARPVPTQGALNRSTEETRGDGSMSPQNPDDQIMLEPDGKPHPPPEDELAAQKDRQLATGILVNADAIMAVPQVLNSISLNNAGLRLVVASRAFDTFFEIFESPKHVNCLEGDQHLASSVGESFDELSRHHPALRDAISDSVIDMVARVRYLGRRKALSDGWGAKLLLEDANGNAVTADMGLFDHLGASSTTEPRKGASPTNMDDLEMVDKTETASEEANTNGSKATTSSTAYDSVTPYIHALCLFLTTYLRNNTLKSHFIQRGGIEILLDIAESPSLPFDFNESNAARKLFRVIYQLVDHSPALGLPSLLKRAQAAVDALTPFSNAIDRPYFAPFIAADTAVTAEKASQWEEAKRNKLLSGTTVIKSLLNAQSLLKTLHECFTTSSRSSTVSLYPVNVFDYYLRLIETLGPLLRAALVEEGAVHMALPAHWWAKKSGPGSDSLNLLGAGPAATAAGISSDDVSLPAMLSGSSESQVQSEKTPVNTQPKRPTKEEQSSPRYKNFETLRVVLHSMVSSVFPFFQQLGKAIFSRRERDLFIRQHHIELAKQLSASILEQLRPSIDMEEPSPKDFQFWIIMLHTLTEMLVDPRTGDRSGVLIIMPVYLAFTEQRGFEVLTSMVRHFAEKIRSGSSNSEIKASAKVCSFGLKRALELFATVVDSKYMIESASFFSLLPRQSESNSLPQQLVLEARMAVFPVVRELWDSSLMEKTQPDILTRIIEILNIVSLGENEPKESKAMAPEILKKTSTPFNWQLHATNVSTITREFGEDLAQEAVFRSNGNPNAATEYCRMHRDGKAGSRNPVPTEYAYSPPAAEVPRPTSQQEQTQTPNPAPSGSEPMTLDPPPELDVLIGDAVLGALEDNSESDEDDNEDDDRSAESSQAIGRAASIPPGAGAKNPQETESRTTTKDDLDSQREQLRKDLISRSLDIVRAHPRTAIEVSQLISTIVSPQPNLEIREEVGTTLTSAITSLSSDTDEVDADDNGGTISAYCHLFALLLHDTVFLNSNLDTLRDNVDAYVHFLKVSPASSKEDLPQWIPYVLLIVEILLSHDEKPVEATWKQPISESETIRPAVLELRDPVFSQDQQGSLLDYVLDLLPRLGKDEKLAISVLRVLVILTRKRPLAQKVGEKKNLQRLFVMAKQLAGAGTSQLKDSKTVSCIMIILRHVVEDEDTVRQVMRSEIRNLFENPQRNQRNLDVGAYLRHLAPVALRAPDLFVHATNDMTKLNRWSPNSDSGARSNQMVLKEPEPESTNNSLNKDESVEPAVQATEDLSLHDVKQSTESGDLDMPDISKPSATRPVIENPDGVVHFLLCELLNYREVDDKEPAQAGDHKGGVQPGSTSQASSSKETSSESQPAGETKETKDKKATKAVFKSDEHPIFIYRCFLLSCLSELLQSYNRAKVEFIDFKRSTPLQTNTPVKPRSSVLNYLINDLLCQDSPAESGDSLLSKKKAATSSQAQQVLVALVTRTGEKAIDKGRETFEYDDDPDLLFVRKFALDTIIKAYERTSHPDENLEQRYTKMQCLAELMDQIVGEKEKDQSGFVRGIESPQSRSQAQLRRMMYEKGYLDKLTSSIADLDLNHAGVKRAIKYVLRVLRVLTDTAKELSRSGIMPLAALPDSVEDDIISTSSMSDADDDREETPDLYRNSALGMLEPRGSDDESDADEDDDEEMYDDDYGDDLEYDEEISEDGDDGVSDDDDEELGEMGEIEGLHGDPGVVEVVMDEDEDMDDEDDELTEDDDLDSDDMEDMDSRADVVQEIVDEDGNPLDDDGNSGWESETDDDEDDEDDEEDIDYEAEAQDLNEAELHAAEDMIDSFARGVLHADVDDDYVDEDMDDLGDHYIDDGRDDDEDNEDLEEDEYIYDEDYPHDDPPPVNIPGHLGWDTLVVEPFPHTHHGHRHRHGHRSPFPPGFIAGGPRDPLGGMSPDAVLQTLSNILHGLGPLPTQDANSLPDFRSYLSRGPRSNAPPHNIDDGVNPLLRRSNQDAEAVPRPGNGPPGLVGLRLPPEVFGHGAGRMGGFLESPMTLLNDIVASLPVMRHGPSSVQLQFTPNGRGELREYHVGPRESRNERGRDGPFHEPQQAVSFSIASTFERYQEEARVVFGGPHYLDKVQKLANVIMSKLVPPALEQEKKRKAEEEERRKAREEERKKREEEERKVREEKEAKEKAEQEAKDREERERAAAAAEAVPATAAGDLPATGVNESAVAQPMEGVEPTEPNVGGPAPEGPRVMATIRGEEVDITELGIDPEYLAALPDEFREEVIAQTVSSRRSQAREDAATGGEQTEVFQEFLDALPEDIRSEIVQQERQETRRRERDEQRRQASGGGGGAAAGQDTIAADMDAASILLTFPPELRHQVLMEQGEDIMDQLPPEMAAQVRLSQRPTSGRSPPGAPRRAVQPQQNAPGEASQAKAPRKTVVQMLDKAGIATLLRLMFVSQHGSIRNYLFSVLGDVCENRHNRLEVISTILLILQEGSTDMDAVERSFSQLSIKAKKPKDKDADPRTPQNLKRTLTSLTPVSHAQNSSELSPLLVVHQCLDLLQDLSTKNPHIPLLFLTEHESVASSLKRAHSRKGKAKDSKANKYAINSLLSLLDRDLVMDSSLVMTYLADLLNKITVPLATMERRRREAAEKAAREAKKDAENASAALAGETSLSATGESAGGNEQASANDGPLPAGDQTTQPSQESPTASSDKPADPASSADDTKHSNQKKSKPMQTPIIPPHNLTLVIKIFVARECSSKTFQNTISAIKNLSGIPGAKAEFGQELVRQAQLLSENIVSDLEQLLPHILTATSGTEIQGVALAKFSPGASEQNKLLRVLTALDHLFDTKKKSGQAADDEDDKSDKQGLVHSLYHNTTFAKMWEKLSACLGAIRQRENMVNVATILLPLIESLMVVCKNTASTDTSLQKQPEKEMVLSSPPPESRMAGLFFNFTEDHRRILNELVRNNPKLMSGTFSLLVKNPKVLEFDNKRNFFNRSVHSRSSSQRPAFPSLQLSVRREHVFNDSYRSLNFKSGDEMKYGKLNIRFHGEEGVDAGGVTREWFQVLARQMFNANYALFIPVSSDRTTFHPNKLSFINDMHLHYFKFVGRIIGKALYEGRVLDCYFSRAVYKRILGKSVSVKDMESFDPDYFKSLVWMLENEITDIITETFSVEDDEFGVTKIVDLCPDGRNVPVTEDNKHEYVRLVVEHKLLSSVKEQMESFLSGFHEIIPEELISIFNEQELELLISGLPDIDIDDWKSNTEYHNYNPASQQIQWFWRAVRSFDKEERAKLLQFVTGTSKVPLNGFKELEGMNGVNRFNIHRDYGNKERLPSSHTCFNQIDLPEYESYDALRSQLMKAITAGSDYFGFA